MDTRAWRNLAGSLVMVALAACSREPETPAPRPAATPPSTTAPTTATAFPSTDANEITIAQFQTLRDGHVDFLLIDCRGSDEAAKERIPGSVLIPIRDLTTYLPLLKLDKDRRLIIYCTVGARSRGMTKRLRDEGFPAVWSLAGGIEAWKKGPP